MWIGHVLRMDDGRIAKQLLYSSLAGRRRRGGQFKSLVGRYTADVKSALSTQQQRDVAAAAEKNAWNDLFAANSE